MSYYQRVVVFAFNIYLNFYSLPFTRWLEERFQIPRVSTADIASVARIDFFENDFFSEFSIRMTFGISFVSV